MECPNCNQEMIRQKWALDLDACSCENCKTRKYYDKKLDRFLTDNEINEIVNDWQ